MYSKIDLTRSFLSTQEAESNEQPKGPSKSELKKRAKEEEKARKAAERRAKEEEAARAKAAEEEANVRERIYSTISF